MNNNNLARIVQNQKFKTLTSVYQQNNNVVTDNVDFKLAMYICYFLDGRIDQLPSFNFLYETINNKQGLISIGYGFAISNSKNLFIEYEEPIRKNVSRIERITCNSHESCIVNKITGATTFITEDLPLFNRARVTYLQNYLSEFYKHYKDNSIKNSK